MRAPSELHRRALRALARGDARGLAAALEAVRVDPLWVDHALDHAGARGLALLRELIVSGLDPCRLPGLPVTFRCRDDAQLMGLPGLGIPIDLADDTGRTALFQVGWLPLLAGRTSMPLPAGEHARILLELGADADHRDHQGRNPLFEVIDLGALQLLTASGADPSAKDTHGATPALANPRGACRVWLAARSARMHAGAARSLVQLLVDAGWVDLAAPIPASLEGSVEVLGRHSPGTASRIVGLLLDSDAVDDVYVGDDDLEAFLQRWNAWR